MSDLDVSFMIRRLKAYRDHLRTRTNDVGRPYSSGTLRNRELGAEDFALFLLDLEPRSDQVRGSLVGERTKRLSRPRSR